MISSVRQQLIERLADGEFHSGSELATELVLSRTAVHNHIEALSGYGLEIYRVKGKGYRLAAPLSLLDAEQLLLGRSVPLHLFWQLDSTNAFLMARRERCHSGEACLAEMQTAGRGRRGRPWVSPLACHLYLSYFWRLEQGMGAVGGLSLAVGVMLAQALERCGYADIELKWPNDLYLQGRKLGGILIEMQGQIGEPCDLVIGCGINVAMPASMADLIDQPWADLQGDSAERVDRTALAQEVLAALATGMQQFEQQGLAPFIAAWGARDRFRDQAVTLLMGEREIQGVARGIDPQGNLQLELASGQIKAFGGGELSLRPQWQN
ncbi:bifunctional biotin--[acetyl-CoA-carboxylase] ligase/biotin operon repressor BirA [Ferrimonas pelagia]